VTSFSDNKERFWHRQIKSIKEIIENVREGNKIEVIFNINISSIKTSIIDCYAFANSKPKYTKIIKCTKGKPEIPKGESMYINRQKQNKLKCYQSLST
jgi:hypothetical protein